MIHIYRTDTDKSFGFFDSEMCEARFILNEVEGEIPPGMVSTIDFNLAVDLPPGITALAKAFVFNMDSIHCYPLHVPSHCKVQMLFRNLSDQHMQIKKGSILVSIAFLKSVSVRQEDLFIHFIGR